MGSKKGKKKAGEASSGTSASPSSEPARGGGECVGWVFWRSPGTGPVDSRVRKDFMDPRVIPKDAREQFTHLMRLYQQDRGSLRVGVHFKHLEGDIWELRYKRNRNPYRLIFARWGDQAVVLDVFYKNQQQTDYSRAAGRYKQWQTWNGDTP